MSKRMIAGWALVLVGTAVWIYGYLVTGHTPLVDWQSNSPWWVADFLPNIESEMGLLLACAGFVPIYWPDRR